MYKTIYPKLKAWQRAKSKRYTHSTTAALEDALSVAWDIINELERALAYAESRTRRAVDILQVARTGPNAYNPNRPCGVRVSIRRR